MSSVCSPRDDYQEYVHKECGIIDRVDIERNLSTALLYEHALREEKHTFLSSTGALITSSGAKKGRSPDDKRIVEEESSSDLVWWGPVNKKMSETVFMIIHERAVDYLNMRERLFVFEGFAGWDPEYRIKVRVLCARAYHALFMQNMLIRPSKQELDNFGDPDFTIYNAGQFPANRYTTGMTSTTSVAINFKKKEMVILGTEYAGEMKKGVFTIMHYLMPIRGVLSLHSSANQGPEGDVSLFFGLSGTGKTTLSADPARKLIGDDEHCWSDKGIFNIEGGCYAKCIDLEREKEPAIFDAIRYGSVLENVVFHETTREVDYKSKALTENTRCAYPIEHIPNAQIPCMGGHPKNIIMLTCDAFGVLPPVSRLSAKQAMYHFISGYTAKIPGTESGITEPTSTFSACFGQPFLVLHPMKYAEMLAEKISKHKAEAWLVNTGWNGGPNGVGKRIAIAHSRSVIDAIHSGELANSVEYDVLPIFNLRIPKSCSKIPSEILDPRRSWLASNKMDYEKAARNLAEQFKSNFAKYTTPETADIASVGPEV